MSAEDPTATVEEAGVEPARGELRQDIGSRAQHTSAGWILMMGGLAAFGPLSIDTYLPAFQAIADDFGSSASSVQVTLSTFLLGTILGTAVAGPLSDRFGRRPSMLAGLWLFCIASLGCAVAPSVEVLAAARLLQGTAVAAGGVIQLAVVRDVLSGSEAARLLSLLLAVTLIGPVVGPLLGSGILLVASWRWTFLLLTAMGAAWIVLAGRAFRETLPAHRRRSGRLRETFHDFRLLVVDRQFVWLVVAGVFLSAAFFVYLAGSSPVLQGVYGLSPHVYAVVFASNGIGMAIVALLNRRLLLNFELRRIIVSALGAALACGVAMVVAVGMAPRALPALVLPLFFILAAVTLLETNATALALDRHPERAGAASTFLRLALFVPGPIVAPFAAVGADSSGLPLALLTCSLLLGGAIALAVALWESRRLGVPRSEPRQRTA